MEEATVPDDDMPRLIGAVPQVRRLSLAVAWCPKEPFRLGEVLILPSNGASTPRIFGRGTAQPGDPHPRLQLVRDRPGAIAASTPLGISRISRVQLKLRALDDAALEVENLGQCSLSHNGVQKSEAVVEAGDTLQLGSQLLFVCIRRAVWLDGDAGTFGSTPFGEADSCGMVGESVAMWQLRQALTFVAAQRGHVLILGASGTGKELAALAIHRLSPRASGPLIGRSAVTLPEGIIDAELFGNAKNFPNAGMPERPGLIGECAGGTLFFDEFAGLSPALQAHLLRVLDAGQYHRLGEATARHSDFRLLIATNGGEATLKHDLAARLPLRVHMSGLGARREDIPLLTRHLLRNLARDNAAIAQQFFSGGTPDGEPAVSVELMRMLLEHEYSTHVRELERLLWTSLERSPGDSLTLEAEPAPGPSALLRSTRPANEANSLSAEQIQECIDRHNGALEPAWRELGLKNRHALARLIVQHDIEVTRKLGRGPIRRKVGR